MMKIWEKQFPKHLRFTAYCRYRKAHRDYFDRLRLGKDPKTGKWGFVDKLGYHGRLERLANKHLGKRCFIIANGPGLKDLDLSVLKDEITIGSNGVYKLFQGELGFPLTYYTMEDQRQIEDRWRQLPDVKGSTRIFPLRSSYCIPSREDTIFSNLEKASYPFSNRYRSLYPLFSEDFASTVYLGSTVTYFNLQLAFHLGCNPVYLIGLDHDYGELTKLFPPGKIEITPEVLNIIEGAHFQTGYHKLGGYIGVPYVEEQEKAFRKAKEVYEARGRQVLNASAITKLEVFERCKFEDLF